MATRTTHEKLAYIRQFSEMASEIHSWDENQQISEKLELDDWYKELRELLLQQAGLLPSKGLPNSIRP